MSSSLERYFNSAPPPKSDFRRSYAGEVLRRSELHYQRKLNLTRTAQNCLSETMICNSSRSASSLWPHFQKEMPVELNREARIVSRYCPKPGSIDIVNYAAASVLQAAKFNGSFPTLGIKSVEQSLILADDVRLGHIKTDVIELSEVLTLREHLFAIDAKPPFELFFPRRC